MFPTGGTLGAVRHMDQSLGGNRLVLVINPQWQQEGQIVSDFGCVPWCIPCASSTPYINFPRHLCDGKILCQLLAHRLLVPAVT